MSSAVDQLVGVEQPPAVMRLLPGLALTAGIGATAYLASHSIEFLKNYQMITAILLGGLLHNAIRLPAIFRDGVAFSLRPILRLSIVLLGLQITAQQAGEIGGAGIAMIALGLLATLGFTLLAGRLLGVPRGLALLIGIGTSICGASAIIAAKAAVRGEDDDAAYAITCVTLFGTLAIFLYPLANVTLHLSPHGFGLWTGASIHEVGQVMATAFDGGPEALRIGAIAKLTRVAMMAPVIIGLGELSVRLRVSPAEGRTRPPFPWFLVGFLVMVGVASIVTLPHPGNGVFDGAARLVAAGRADIANVAAFLLSMAMAAMGLHTDLRHIRSRGLRPLALGLLATLFISLSVLATVLWIS